jgi:hypothetical protein
MKIRGLMVLVLILVLVTPTLSLFQSTAPVSYQTGASGGSSVIIIAKEDYVYARVLITIQPDSGYAGNVVTMTFPNGTTIAITGPHTEAIVLPNTIYYSFSSVAAGGQGFSVSSGHPLDVSLQSGQNATDFLLYGSSQVPIEGIHVFSLLINGTATVEVQELGVSL